MSDRDPIHPFDPAFAIVRNTGGLPRLTTQDALRILAANRFRNPVFHDTGAGNCDVTGPDGRTYNAEEVLRAILMAERLERLCQDRSDAVIGMLNRNDECSVWRGPKDSS